MPRSFLRTSDVARAVGLHPNTIRRYEEWGFLPPIPRAANGYRQFTHRHVDQLRLTRLALRISWMGGAVRRQAYAVIYNGAEGDLTLALEHAEDLQKMVRREEDLARAAAAVLEQWAHGETAPRKSSPPLSIGKTARLLTVSVDMLRSWERNGLLDVPRNPANGYRQYGPAEIDRLRVIRTLRKARYSTMAILRMMLAFEQGQRTDLTAVLDTPHPDEDAAYVTDQWLTTLTEMDTALRDMLALLHHMILSNE
jgi:DNA-binding transcriptional MerR regulator